MGRKRMIEEEAISCEERNSTGMTFTSVARNPSGRLHTHTHMQRFILDCLLRVFKLKTLHPEMHI